jgi:uncharacterized protein with ParB-like and HNH nuclease domain
MDNNSTISVKPDKIRLPNLLEEIEKGEICVPIFQRDFVWKTNQMINLFDSISKGYPIGSLLFWSPEKKYRTMSTMAIYELNSATKNIYVLDGSQRITTIFGVLSNPLKYNKSERDLKDYLLYYNL